MDQRNRKLVPLGYVSGLHGVRGWIKVHSWTRPREAVFEYQPWLLGDERQPATIQEGRVQGKTLIVSLPGIVDREAARSLVDQEIAVFRDQLPELPADEYYWSDLVGLAVFTVQGIALGEVSGLLETGVHDVLVVKGERERLIPFVPERYVTSVDLEAGRIEVDWDPEF
jgi:16S rRNA processing protein RimM